MAFFKILLAAGVLAVAMADVSEIVGRNQYLPPSKGYNYDKPSIPFPSPTPFPSAPGPRPTPFPSGPGPVVRPTPGFPQPRPTFQPQRPTFVPQTPSTAYIPAPTRPAPRPIPNTGYQPGGAPSGQQGTVIGPSGGDGSHDHHHHHHEPGMPYDFEYKVKDDNFGNDYSRNEVSDGDVIRGEYRVQLPDGRLQIVKYTADWANGYNAEVTYQGTPVFPTGSGSGSFPTGSGSASFPSQSPNAYIPPARF